MLPQDPFILLSYVNTKLRDEYESLEALCAGLQADRSELVLKLEEAGFHYDPAQKRFH